MNLISRLMQGLTGTGAHRAADRIPALEAEVAYWQALAGARQEQLARADELITRLVASRDNAQLEAREHRTEAARVPELLAQIQNLQAIRVRAAADSEGPTITLPRYSPDATTTAATTLWNAHGLRPNARAQQAA